MMRTARVTLAIDNLSRERGGALTVERALAARSGVVHAYVDPATEMAYVEYDPSAIRLPDLLQAISDLGYSASEPIFR